MCDCERGEVCEKCRDTVSCAYRRVGNVSMIVETLMDEIRSDVERWRKRAESFKGLADPCGEVVLGEDTDGAKAAALYQQLVDAHLTPALRRVAGEIRSAGGAMREALRQQHNSAALLIQQQGGG